MRIILIPGGGVLSHEKRIQTANFGNDLRETRVLHGFRGTHARSERNAPDILLNEKGEPMKPYEFPSLTLIAIEAADVLRTSGEGPNETPKIDLLKDLDP